MKQKSFSIWMSVITTLNVFTLLKMQTQKDIRTDSTVNYLEGFRGYDIFAILTMLVVFFVAFYMCLTRLLPYIKPFFLDTCDKESGEVSFKKTFAVIGVTWLVFFLAFSPGTAMNDTIYIIQNPWQLSRQHPIIYNLYITGLYKVGCFFRNPNIGLILNSLIQIVIMDYLLSDAICMVRKELLVKKWVCKALSMLFACSPVFFTYAFSAIKDTLYAAFVFEMVILGMQWWKNPKIINEKSFIIKWIISFFFVTAFRNNGVFVSIGILAFMFFYSKKELKTIIISGLVTVTLVVGISSFLTRNIPEPYFQEKIGIQLQQIAAVMNKSDNISANDREYLYKILPEAEWEKYAPACSDILKWNKKFDREYLNETKNEFLKIWIKYLPQNFALYTEAYLLNSYGIWGIETRNSEQYYVKKIFDNNLGLEQESILPEKVHDLLYTYYCNRYTYGYMSAGTLLWILTGLIIYSVCMKKKAFIMMLIPVALNSISVLLATPIAFCFRYSFCLALCTPFIILALFFTIENQK